MSLLLIAPNQDMNLLKDSLLAEDPNLDVEIWPQIKNKSRVTFAVSWNHPHNVLGNFPNLQVASSFGAGVDHLLKDKSLPASLKICRIVTDELQQHIADYILSAVLNYRFNIQTYFNQKQKAEWKQWRAIPQDECEIGILGLGKLGKLVGKRLIENGYQVSGWSRSRKEIEGITSYAGNKELNDFLSSVNILICLLPLTPETEGILNLDTFKQLKKPSYLINTGRGSHLVDEDLIYALDSEIVKGACLDVFGEEPLPEKHPFWNRPNIMITPHVAGFIRPEQSAPVIVENYKRALSGQELLNEVDRERGY